MWWKVSRFLLALIILVVLPVFAGEFLVTNSNNDGAGSLRLAIQQSNAQQGVNKIVFNIPVDDPSYDAEEGVWKLQPSSPLPSLTGGKLEIDGSVQTRNKGDTNPNGPEIMIDGSMIADEGIGFEIVSRYNWIHDLIVGNFGQNEIVISGKNARRNKITGCYIGISADGSAALKSVAGLNGVMIAAGADSNTIGSSLAKERNVIGGMKLNGILIEGDGCNNNIIVGNYVGTDATGTQPIPNKQDGIRLQQGTKNNRIGGSLPGEGNVFSGNLASGIRLEGPGVDENTIMGNKIGVASDGITALGNGDGGVVILKGASHNIIGSIKEGAANIISSNHFSGLQIKEHSNFNEVSGNLIGPDITGKNIVGNEHNGIMITHGASNNKIGPQNIISGNGFQSGDWASGIVIAGDSTEKNQVFANLIGLLYFQTPAGNVKHGICIQDGARYNKIGPQNIIANNGGDGIQIVRDQTLYNTITQNSIFSNSNKGIDVEEGANLNIAPPVLNTVNDGLIKGYARKNSHVEIYKGPDTEGKVLVGMTFTDENGEFTFEASNLDRFMTATVTDNQGNTSEFSASLKTDVPQITAGKQPLIFSLEQNYPNPFNPSTTIAFSLATDEFVTLDIFNVRGQLVARLIEKRLMAGRHQMVWDIRNNQNEILPSGTYFYRIIAGHYHATKKLTLLK